MRITYKLTVLHILALTVVLALYGWLSVHREVELIEADKQRDTRAYGTCLAELVREVWTDHGDQRAIELLRRVDSSAESVLIRWVWLVDDDREPGARALEQLRERVAVVQIDHAPDGGRLTTYVPVIVEAGRVGVVSLQESLDDESAYVRDSVRRVALTTVIAAALLGALAAIVGSRLVGAPMQELVALARRVGQGDLTRRLALTQRDEVGELASEMNLMCDRLAEAREQLQRETAARIETLERLRQNDRLATVGRIAAGMAHELGTPLSVIQGHAELIAEGALEAAQLPESAKVIGQLTRRMAGTIRQMLDFARRRGAEKDVHDLSRLTRRTLDMLGDLARRAGVTVRVTGDKVMAEVDGGQVEQVVTNLALNAIHSMPEGGVLEAAISADRATPPPDHPSGQGGPMDVACITIRDQGTGIRTEHLEVLFEPFFTTKPVGKGTGLGLPIAQGIVQEHGGWIEVESELGRGSTFRVHLPRGVVEG